MGVGANVLRSRRRVWSDALPICPAHAQYSDHYATHRCFAPPESAASPRSRTAPHCTDVSMAPARSNRRRTAIRLACARGRCRGAELAT